ncbi:hypothetical protein SynPROS91_01198 [Synechococcus sp. PROS-9-1]|nr:hypothetical protein SynPROS91_01198 [Synechococcus sp. PROS-9-1]
MGGEFEAVPEGWVIATAIECSDRMEHQANCLAEVDHVTVN